MTKYLMTLNKKINLIKMIISILCSFVAFSFLVWSFLYGTVGSQLIAIISIIFYNIILFIDFKNYYRNIIDEDLKLAIEKLTY